MRTTQQRRPRGTPTGGQFAPTTQAESAVAVESDWPGFTLTKEPDGDRSIEVWRDGRHYVQDPPDGSPAVRSIRSDGVVQYEHHYRDGRLDDPADGSPAVRVLHRDGSVLWSAHYRLGVRQDLAKAESC